MPERSFVLITRPEPGASATARRLAESGFRPVLAPLLMIRQLTPRLPVATCLQASMVTSAHALPALQPQHRCVALYAVGDATAKAACGLGFGTVVSAAGDAAALRRLVARSCRPTAGPILLAVGRGRGAGVAAALRQEGFAVIRRSVYAALPVARFPDAGEAALRAGRLDAALFFSAETAALFARLIGAGGLRAAVAPLTAIAIGPAAAAALRPLPFRSVRVAVRPTEEAVLAMLE